MHQRPRNAVALGILITIVTLGLTSGHLPLSPTASADSQRLVSVYADDQKRLLPTDASTVGEVLKRSNIQLGAGDLVEPSVGSSVPAGQFNVNVYRARPVMITDGAKTYRIFSAYQSPHLLAQAAGLTVYPEDTYDTSVITDFVGQGAIGFKVGIKRAKLMTVLVDGKSRVIRTQATTVADALKGANIPLGLKDTVSLPGATPVSAAMSLSITRVSEAMATLTEAIPRTVQTISDPNVVVGQTSVRTEGSDGSRTTTYRIHYANGLETARESVQVVAQTAPVTRVVVSGTKVMFAGSVEYWRPQVVEAATAAGLDPNMMMRIMSCESGGNATSTSHFIVNGEHPTGLFQYLPSTWRSAGGTDSNIFDGALQIKLTAKKMSSQGTGAWQCR